MNDLRPYVCTVEECNRPHEQFSTVNSYFKHELVHHDLLCSVEECSESSKKFVTVGDYLKHVVESHKIGEDFLLTHLVRFRKQASIKCLFCDQVTTEGTGKDSRGGHVGRHMEEIAFLVVPKVYEDWDFYSDSSSSVPQSRRPSDSFVDRHPRSKGPSEERAPLPMSHGKMRPIFQNSLFHPKYSELSSDSVQRNMRLSDPYFMI